MIYTRNEYLIALTNRIKLNSGLMRIGDNSYYLPTMEQLNDAVIHTLFEDYQYKIDKFDCEDFALIAHAFFRQCQYTMEWPNPWAVGEIWGYFKEVGGHHAKCFAFTSDKGLLFLEPQTDAISLIDTLIRATWLRG